MDDSCLLTPPAEIQDLRVTHSGDIAHLTWTGAADACTTYVVEESAVLPAMTDLATGLSTPMWSDTTPLGSTGLRYYLIRADSFISGPGQ